MEAWQVLKKYKMHSSTVTIGIHKLTLDVASAYVSTAFQIAIDEENEEQIAECQKDMRGNDPLREQLMLLLVMSKKNIC